MANIRPRLPADIILVKENKQMSQEWLKFIQSFLLQLPDPGKLSVQTSTPLEIDAKASILYFNEDGTTYRDELLHYPDITGDVTNADSKLVFKLNEITEANVLSFRKFANDTKGRITESAPVTTSDLRALLDDTYVNQDGDTMTGDLTVPNLYSTNEYVSNTVNVGSQVTVGSISGTTSGKILLNPPGAGSWMWIDNYGGDNLRISSGSAPQSTGAVLIAYNGNISTPGNISGANGIYSGGQMTLGTPGTNGGKTIFYPPNAGSWMWIDNYGGDNLRISSGSAPQSTGAVLIAYNGNISTPGDVSAGSITTSGTVTTGNINGTNITASGALTGASLSVSGASTLNTVSASGVSNFTNSTAATSTSTGAVTITGGLGVGGRIYSGQMWPTLLETANAGSAASTITAYLAKGSSDTNFRLVARNGSGSAVNTEHARLALEYSGAINTGISFYRGGSAVGGWLGLSANNGTEYVTIKSADTTVANILRLTSGTASTSTTTGTLVVTGGAGVSGNIYAGGSVNGATGAITGALTAGSFSTSGTASTGALTATSSTINGNETVTGTANLNGTVNVGVAGSASGKMLFNPPNAGSWMWIDNPGTNTLRISSGTLPTSTNAINFTYDGNISANNLTLSSSLSAASGSVSGALSVGSMNTSGTVTTGALTATSISTSGTASTGALTATSATVNGAASITGTANIVGATTLGTAGSVSGKLGVYPGGVGNWMWIDNTNTALRISAGTVPSSTNAMTFSYDGKITANYFIGDGSSLTNVAASSAVTAQTVTTGAQPSITSVGTLTGLTSSGAVSITNSTESTSTTTGALKVTGGISSQKNLFIGGTGNFTGVLNASNSTNLKGDVTLGVAGSVSGRQLFSPPNAGSWMWIDNPGTNTLRISSGTVPSSTNAINFAYDGTITAPAFNGDGSALTSITGANVTGTVPQASVVTTGAQPSITSVGTLTGLTSSGAVSITNSTASTSTTTGALKVTGGVGIGGDVYSSTMYPTLLDTTKAGSAVGTITAYLAKGASDVNFRLVTRNGSGSAVNTEHARIGLEYSGTNNAGISFYRGGSAVGGWLGLYANDGTEYVTIKSTSTVISNPTRVTDTTASSSTTSGAFVVSGGVGVTGNIYNTGNIISSAGYASTLAHVSTRLTNPTAPSGTASTTGGTLADGVYYAVIVARDARGAETAISPESSVVTCTGGGTSSIAWTWTAVTNATSYIIYFSQTPGTLVNNASITNYATVTTNSYSLTSLPSGGATRLVGYNRSGGFIVKPSDVASTDMVGLSAYGAPFRTDSTVTHGTGTTFTPLIGQTTRISAGYVHHNMLGSYRTNSAWEGGMFLSTGGNDNYPTQWFTFGYGSSGGKLSHSTGALVVDNATLRVNSTTASTSTTTGALVVSGGVGIGGATYINGVLNASNSTNLKGDVTLGAAGSVSGRQLFSPPNAGSWMWIDNPGTNTLRISAGTTPSSTDAINFTYDGTVNAPSVLATYQLGYTTGAGGTVTQATSKSTGVTLNKASGAITMNGAALASGSAVSFVLTNSIIGADDTLIVHRKSGGTAAAYYVWCDSIAAGSATICVRNISAGSLSEAIVLSFNVMKGATA